MTAAWRVALVWFLLMLGGIWLAMTRLSVHSELGDLLPEGSTTTQRLLLTQVRTGLAWRLLLLAVEGGSPDELASVSRQLSDSLRASGRFAFVGNGAQMWSKDEQILLFRSRYLLSRAVAPHPFSAESLRAALEQRLDDLRSPLAPLMKESIPADPTGEFLGILQTLSGWERPTTHRGVWMSKDRTRALLVAETKAAGFDADAQESIQLEILAIFQRLVNDRAPTMRLLMSGPGVFAVAIQRTIEAEVWRLSTIAAALVMLFLYASYRSITVVLLSLIPISSGILAGMVAVNGSFGFIHGITLGFGIALLGVVDDYPIHLFSHLTSRNSAQAVMQAIWPTMRLSVLTTAIGFSALLLAGLPALAQLGLFSVAGLLTAAAVTRWCLPAFVPSGFSPREIRFPSLARVDVLRRWKLLVPMMVVLATVALVWSDTPLWQGDLASLSPVPEERKQLDQQLRGELGAPDLRDLLVIEGKTEEVLLEGGEALMPRLDELRNLGSISGYDIVTRYLPSRRTQQERQRALPERKVLEQNLHTALQRLPFAHGVFAPFLDDVESARRQPLVDRSSFHGTPLATKIESLMFKQSEQWTAVVPLQGVANRESLRTTVAEWGIPGVAYVDLKKEADRLMTAYRDRALIILGWGTVAIALVLAMGLRSTALLRHVLPPIMCALVVVAAVLNLSGESFSLFHVLTFLLVIGLGLDYTLFFNRPEGTEAERTRTVFGLLVCSTTTILVFGVLAFSKIPVLHAIGTTAACGSFCSLLFAGLMAKKEVHAV